MNNYQYNVFINCPFDKKYNELFNSLVFVIYDCGFIVRSAWEIDDSDQIRFDKLSSLIKESKYGVHDLSRTELDRGSKLPRFNMPLELGLFLGAKRYGIGNNKKKKCLIFDKEKFRYQMFISDIAGQDIKSHNNDIKVIISTVRNWLRNNQKNKNYIIPSGSIIYKRYLSFKREIPTLCNALKLKQKELIFNDYVQIVINWIKANDIMV